LQTSSTLDEHSTQSRSRRRQSQPWLQALALREHPVDRLRTGRISPDASAAPAALRDPIPASSPAIRSSARSHSEPASRAARVCAAETSKPRRNSAANVRPGSICSRSIPDPNARPTRREHKRRGLTPRACERRLAHRPRHRRRVTLRPTQLQSDPLSATPRLRLIVIQCRRSTDQRAPHRTRRLGGQPAQRLRQQIRLDGREVEHTSGRSGSPRAAGVVARWIVLSEATSSTLIRNRDAHGSTHRDGDYAARITRTAASPPIAGASAR